MKKYLHLIVYAGIIISCQNNNRQMNIPTSCGMVEIKTSELIDSLRAYHKKNFYEDTGGVMVIDFLSMKDTSILYISSIVHKVLIKHNPPANYSIVDGVPVLFYTGIEKSLTLDSVYLATLHETVDPFLEESLEDEHGNIIQMPPNYNPEVWMIKMVSNKIVNTVVMN